MECKWRTRVMGLLTTIGLLVTILLGLLWIAWQAEPVYAATIIVDAATGVNATNCGDGVNPPCLTIQYALDNRAIAGDTVHVLPGTYAENITMEAGVIISGSGATVTTIDGTWSGSVVSAGSGIAESAVLRGFTIQRGHALDGAGLSISGGATPIIETCIVYNNIATGRGGGMFVQGNLVLETNQIISNSAGTDGGGLYVTGDAILSGTQFLNNTAGEDGGGAYVAGTVTFTETQMEDNTAGLYGGGLYQFDADGEVRGSGGHFENNQAPDPVGNGGGIFVGGSVILSGTQAITNTAGRGGGGLFIAYDAVLTDVQVIDNTAGRWGGGIYQNFFDNQVDRVELFGGRLERNRSTLNGVYPGGGGMFSSASVTMNNTQVISNVAASTGGGVHASTNVTLTGVEFIDNKAGGQGGGLDASGSSAQLFVTGGRFERNESTGSATATSGNGGAIYSANTATLSGTQVFSNTAESSGGGIYVGNSLWLTDTQVVDNQAVGAGGGVYQNTRGHQVRIWGGRVEGNESTGSDGGGLRVRGSTTIVEGQVLDNTASNVGGGLAGTDSVYLTDAQFADNVAGSSGGGLYQADLGYVVNVTDSLFESNVSQSNLGGGLYVGGAATLSQTRLLNNSALGMGGGGLYGDRAVLSINNLFAGNTGVSGAAIYLQGNSGTQTVRHTTVVRETLSGGSAIYVRNGTATIENTIITTHTIGIRRLSGTAYEDYNLFYGNTADTSGGVTSGGHSLSGQAPRFVDASSGNYHIDTESAALDAGAFGLGVLDDFDGDARPTNSALPDTPDIGYDENKSLSVHRMLDDTMTFGAACARIVFTDTGSLGASDSITITVEPGVFPSGVNPSAPVVSRTVNISVSNSAAVSATLSLCYLDSEAAGLDEPSLQLFRWTGNEWEGYSSTVDTVNNLVTGGHVITFSPWLIGEDVGAMNEPPVAVDDIASTDEGTPVLIDVLANDYDPDGSLDPTTVAIVSDPGNGSVSVDPLSGEVTYTPDPDYNGNDSFTYTVDDDQGATSNEATVSIDVSAVNEPPIAVDDIASTDEGTPVLIDVLANDYDPDGSLDPTTVAIVSDPGNGSVSVDPLSGEVTYTPDPDYNGNDSFTYTVDDDQGATSNEATVTVSVTASSHYVYLPLISK